MTTPFLPDDVARCSGVSIAPAFGNYQPQGPGIFMVECRDCLRRTAPPNNHARAVVMQPPMPALTANITSADAPTPTCPERITP